MRTPTITTVVIVAAGYAADNSTDAKTVVSLGEPIVLMGCRRLVEDDGWQVDDDRKPAGMFT